MQKQSILVLGMVLFVVTGFSQATVMVDWVMVGDPGNVADDTGYGSVEYVYQVGKYEVTNRQYCEFLNTVAAADPFGLYNLSMDSSSPGGIVRQGEIGYYTYLVKSGYANKPVVYVSRLDAMRFANWFHNGQGSGGTEDGVYNLSLGENIVRKENALIWVCSENEWYKAAYYKAGGLNAGYWDYPTQSNSAPVHELPPGGTNSAHYWNSGYGPVDVGSYVLSPGAYGTFDQAGNVWEKTDTKISSGWIARGGSFATTDYALPSWHHDGRGTLSGESGHAGFRIASVPEPTTAYVAVDIKPQSCPNPLNVRSKGVLPAAILGSEELDVNTIDAASIRLAGIAPIRSSYEDVAAPTVDASECECIAEGPDGFLDLTLKFKTQEIVEALGEVSHREVLVLTLTGVLFDETPIEGADCIAIRGKHKPFNKADINKDGVVNLADFAIITGSWLESSVVEH